MFEHILHMQQLHIDFGGTQVRVRDLLAENGRLRSARLARYWSSARVALTRTTRHRLPATLRRLASPTATAATMPAPPRFSIKSSTLRATPSVAATRMPSSR